MQPALYVVTTPLGNLGDLTPRAAETLAGVDFIAAEDTRVTVKLLNHLGIKKPMLSYHEHNKATVGEGIIARIAAGESCALCSDAGVPAVSDPGETLVQQAIDAGVRVVPIPGASAAVTALCVSGQLTGRFVFEGFLPMNRRARAEHIEGLLREQRTILLYEAPHKLTRTLADLAAAFGEGRGITLCRELTKLHEEIWKTTLGEALAHYSENTPRGEFVLVVAGYVPPAETGPQMTLDEAAALARRLAAEEGLSPSAAAKAAAAQSGLPKSGIYRAVQEGGGT